MNMLERYPGRFMLLGVFMMLLGVILPILMVMHILESTFFLNFFSFGVSVSGLFIGLISLAFYSKRR
jgi:hypothetical protein